MRTLPDRTDEGILRFRGAQTNHEDLCFQQCSCLPLLPNKCPRREKLAQQQLACRLGPLGRRVEFAIPRHSRLGIQMHSLHERRSGPVSRRALLLHQRSLHFHGDLYGSFHIAM